MHSMAINRRHFLTLLMAAGAWPVAGATTLRGGSDPLYLAARKQDGQYEVAVFDATGRDRYVAPLPDRGHSFAIDAKRNRAIAFGRQPGFFAVAFDLDGQRKPVELQLAPQRHFFGHGVYTPDGRVLFATENDYEAGQGVLGIYDVSASGNHQRLGEFPTAGTGPHEVILMPDDRTLCVANGGILTHPDYGKLELNLDTMKPSLAYIDTATGQLLEQVFLPDELHRLSLRHLALDASGAVWVGCQYMGPRADQPALVARHQRGSPMQLIRGPEEVVRGMRNYVGSVAADPSGGIIATSSPVGNCIVFWDAASAQYIDSLALDDGCGVAPAGQNGFLLSSGLGVLASVNPSPDSGAGQNANATPTDAGLQRILPTQAGRAWDNHMRRV